MFAVGWCFLRYTFFFRTHSKYVYCLLYRYFKHMYIYIYDIYIFLYVYIYICLQVCTGYIKYVYIYIHTSYMYIIYAFPIAVHAIENSYDTYPHVPSSILICPCPLQAKIFRRKDDAPPPAPALFRWRPSKRVYQLFFFEQGIPKSP